MVQIRQLSVTATAERLGLSEDRVRAMFREGTLTGSRRRLGSGWSRIWIDLDSVDRVAELRNRRSRGPSPRTLARALEVGVVGDLRTLVR